MNTAGQRALTRSYRKQLAVVRGASVAALARAWDQHGNVDDAAVNAWLRASVPILTAARMTNAQAAASYTARLFGMPARAGTVNRGDLQVRAGVSERELLTRPVISMRLALASGLLWADAHQAAGDKATSILTTDMNLAAREGSGAVAPDGTRWLKVPSGDCCDWCDEMAGDSYGSADSVPMHPNDTCDVLPETDGTSAVRDEAVTPVPQDAPDAVVIDNAELGPVKG